ncbi:hypothetical protein L6452_37993 [Arctium lappa]|uniref:Uncharacterized protein n=1 Tax=Arctium lappa TaxID=4217 RepID=A0ACB8Y559_ARCLA|nr:hypothetical protein L6452_37993 [Arctium lappa]
MADDLCFSTTTTAAAATNNPPLISTLFLHNLPLLCSFIVSHPLYFSYFLFFSPYFIKLISLFSPLFFTTTLLLLLSVLATTSKKLGFVQTVLDKLRSKMNGVDEEEEEDHEVCNLEDFEIYKLVFRDVPSSLIDVGDGDRMEEVSVMENSVEVAGKSEEEMSLERLFEELDRFDDSVAAIEVKEKETSSDLVEVVGGLHKPEAVEMEKLGGESMAVATETTTIISGEDQKTVLNSKNSWRLDSCSSFGSYESMKMEMVKLGGESMAVATETTTIISGKDKKTVPNSKLKSNPLRLDSCSSFESYESMKMEIEKLGGESMAVATKKTTIISGEDQKTVPNSKLKSNSLRLDSCSSFGSYECMKMEIEKHGGKSMAVATKTTTIISGEDQKTVPNSKLKSNSLRLDSCSSFESYGSMSMEMEKLCGESMAAATETTIISGEDQNTVPKSKPIPLRSDSCSSFGSYGSMRKEKEWKRTLACKLFEERRNSEGGEEGMDSLWEAYETDHSSITKSKNKKVDAMVKHKKTLTKNKIEFKYFDDLDEEDDDDEFMMSNGQLCCLKALKLSAGKMNLGMGKPNLVKISKALKGFGWLHHVGTKNGKRI